MFTSFTVFLDACVLVPNWLRDVLLTAADFELYRPRWSPTVLAETRNALITKRRLTAEQADYTLATMTTYFPEAMVEGYESIVPGMPAHHKDRHVVAAALVGHAQLIVTNNIKDFQTDQIRSLGLDVRSADTFLMDLLARYEAEMKSVLQFMADNTGKAGKPELSTYDILQNIAATAKNFAAAALFKYEIT